MCKIQCVNGSASRTSWTDQLDGAAGRSSWTDQLDGAARQTSWRDQFFLFEALASLHIQRFSFQFVHCRSFRVRRRPCLLISCLPDIIQSSFCTQDRAMDPTFRIKYIRRRFMFNLMEILILRQIPLYFEAPCDVPKKFKSIRNIVKKLSPRKCWVQNIFVQKVLG